MDANPTLDQLQIFIAVADAGGFSAAARRLNRAQSVISYGISNLEAQLQVQLFDRDGTRVPQLTEAGRALLTDARRILAGLEGMRARAGGLRQGLEAEITLAVDVTVPAEALAEVLRAFETEYPTVAIRLHVGALGVVYDQVMRQLADLGISGSATIEDETQIVTASVGASSMIPVAAPDHPLAVAGTPVPPELVREQTQLVITDLTDQTRGKDFGVLSYRTWRLTDMGMKRALIAAGLGWGGLPYAMAQKDIQDGRLVWLDIESYPERAFPLYAIHHVRRTPGPATRWMIERFRLALAACDAHRDIARQSA
ncbi:LysR family transcriptional regulator [Nitratireductor mangrovi]|uniref:LysR family transcriptional regulator n=1 Tax=Nitratireductor mangrovi TaxID=2599600 RepID=A0A5B8KYS8_9HYPH|nr:LysR family transcriptional regulator [Nitratireductor mangrovi]QDZ00739.1 LysR family transcriptional regulator [Nitratireductor mangrovi]